jgi:hypothetical protein
MKKTIFASLALAAFAQYASAQSIVEKLPGNWNVTQIALDVNGNGQPDKSEQEDVTSLGFYFTLSNDGTGSGRMDIFTTRDNRFIWNISNNGTEINFSGEGNGDLRFLFYKLADAKTTLHIDKISGNNMQLSTNDGGMMWLTLKRK